MRTRDEDKKFIQKYTKHIKVTVDDYIDLKKINQYVVARFNENIQPKYRMQNQPIGRIVTLLLKEHETKKDYINMKRKAPIDPLEE
jgi:hypothetical protein